MTDPTSYPEWFYYPSRTRPPNWVTSSSKSWRQPGR
jgi:hypothetical protein